MDYYSVQYTLAEDSETDYDDDEQEDTGIPLAYRLAEEVRHGGLPDDDGVWQDEQEISNMIAETLKIEGGEHSRVFQGSNLMKSSVDIFGSTSKLVAPRKRKTEQNLAPEISDTGIEFSSMGSSTFSNKMPQGILKVTTTRSNAGKYTKHGQICQVVESSGTTTSENSKTQCENDKYESDDDESDMKLMKSSFAQDPFYDAELDITDSKWVKSHTHAKSEKLSDAVLSCPYCFTTLTFQCQQHSKYAHQFRAMIVMNCVVDRSSSVTVPKSSKVPLKSVRCASCGTDVGVQGDDDIFEFYNVLPSAS